MREHNMYFNTFTEPFKNFEPDVVVIFLVHKLSFTANNFPSTAPNGFPKQQEKRYSSNSLLNASTSCICMLASTNNIYSETSLIGPPMGTMKSCSINEVALLLKNLIIWP